MSIDVGWVAPIVGAIVGAGVIFLGVLGYALAKAAGDTDDQDGRPRG